jgi:hypothetical protein
MAYPRYLVAMNSGLQNEAQRLAQGIYPSLMPNFRGLIQLLLGARVPGAILQGLTATASVALLAWAAVKRLPMELMVVVMVLVSYHGLIHDSVVMLLPVLTCQIVAAPGYGKRLLVWGALVGTPALAFVLHLPLALLSVVYVAFLVVMERDAAFSSSGRTGIAGWPQVSGAGPGQ